ncbi:hypothetical protein IF2G_01006 [Cordyceps javanica]|nr:hypothetical protein IF2G_01006 [Cordyceps javanica]
MGHLREEPSCDGSCDVLDGGQDLLLSRESHSAAKNTPNLPYFRKATFPRILREYTGLGCALVGPIVARHAQRISSTALGY